MNTTILHNEGSYVEAVTQRGLEIGLVTVSNHTSTMDDPALHAVLLPASFFFSEHTHKGTRWVTCAEEICFRNEFLRQFFITGKTLPVKRGAGIQQPVMRKVSELVKAGDWVHVFPEGRIGYKGSLQDLKWGVGKIICDALDGEKAPIVLPFYHSGMGEVMPRKARVPRFHNEVNIIVGDVLDLSHLTCKCHKTDRPEETWIQITQEIQKALQILESQCPKKNKQQQEEKRQSP